MTETENHQKRFQAAVDVIQSLPKKGEYTPSYDVMLRFYGLYKQAMCGPCKVAKPGFWDPVGRYKWDAWNRLGEMSSEAAMTAYVDEMKKIAQEVIDCMPINEKTASFFHYFEPLYSVIHDMPRPPEALLSLRPVPDRLLYIDVNANIHIGKASPIEELKDEVCREAAAETVPQSDSRDKDPALTDAQVLTSDSESENFCDTVEQLDNLKAMQVGAGEGGEGGGEGHGAPMRRTGPRKDGTRHGRRDPNGGAAHRGVRWNDGLPSGPGGGGAGGSQGGAGGPQGAHVQQQIVLALRRLRQDMQSVMERLEVVEGLAAANAQSSEWRTQLQALEPEDEGWWPLDVSGQTLLLLLLWPFVAHGLLLLLGRRKRKSQLSVSI
ncbi:acyl-CoA-binding domain-containing protein 4 isoform X1 [Denticeps clupeoides]|uniref:acyl-CoA-binding domain-containing protein 4 isoform X1 n=1 Tax=Denticeps clupeoides TaxID=299321 RepID=UPI0010A50C71|nr:acyl-CoA-binding domain-containing protein 4 isoform X1 [Denticeps clupeoides]XP_028823131.1 acyl-CoA-binding domain-containing protein 4 isoform X1 [Denticeps clupeoides]XP_028823132.1 acyl-CoA-binding domain-containing protein 4 isoform X1 [Denticeps clupeoides]